MLKQLQIERIVGIVRLQDSSNLVELARVLQDTGVNFLEITLTTPNAFEVIEKISGTLDNKFYVGAGTVTTFNLAEKAIKSGAKFIVSPNTDSDVIEKTKSLDMVSMPGIATATEVGRALKAGADILKLFPASTYGPAHLKALRDPYPGQIWCPTGGISLGSVDDWFAAGANLIGLGGPLTKGGLGKVSENVTAFLNAVSSANKVG